MNVVSVYKDRGIYKTVGFVASCLMAIGCAHTKPYKAPHPLGDLAPRELKLKPSNGREELTQYYSHSAIKAYENHQLVREREELAEFSVLMKYLRYDQEKDFIHILVQTVRKDGMVDLHDLAFPEIDERMEIVYLSNAEVAYAGGYPHTSVFFLPPISLPDGPVKVGDTWTMERSWVSLKNSMPLRISMVSILKNFFKCGERICADIEVSGEVGIIASLNKDTSFISEIKGRVLFDTDRGAVLWSTLKSEETMVIQENRMEIRSCLASQMIEPANEKWEFADSLECNPKVFQVSGPHQPKT